MSRDILAAVREFIDVNCFDGPMPFGFGDFDPTPVVVLFPAAERDNGWYLGSEGTVYFDNGTSQDAVDFGIQDALIGTYGAVSVSAGLVLDVRTGDVRFDANVDTAELVDLAMNEVWA